FDVLERHTIEWGIADPSHIPYAADAVAAYLAAGRPGDAERIVGRLAACPLPSRWPAAIATAGRAALAAHAGDLATAESRLPAARPRQGGGLLRRLPVPPARARIPPRRGVGAAPRWPARRGGAVPAQRPGAGASLRRRLARRPGPARAPRGGWPCPPHPARPA